jgi:hypothetical protein
MLNLYKTILLLLKKLTTGINRMHENKISYLIQRVIYRYAISMMNTKFTI